MSPRFSLALAAAGVLLAGLPLIPLTGRNAPDAPAPAPAVQTESMWLGLRYTGAPECIVLRHAGREIARIDAPPPGETWESELQLPAGGRLELELEARWPAGEGGTAHAVTLTAAPSTKAEAAETHWAEPGEATLHRLFTLTW